MTDRRFRNTTESVGFLEFEAAYGTPPLPVQADYFRHLGLDMGQTIARRPSAEQGQGRSVRETIEGRRAGTWSASIYGRPPAARGQAPAGGDLLRLALGVEQLTANTSAAYKLLADMFNISATLWAKHNLGHDVATGCIVNQLSIDWGGQRELVYGLRGQCQQVTRFLPIAQGAEGAGTNTTALTVTDQDRIGKGASIRFATSGAGSTPRVVVAADGTAATLDANATWADNATIHDALPGDPGSALPKPLFGTRGSFSWDGGSTDSKVVSGQVAVATGVSLDNTEFGRKDAGGVLSDGRRTINATIVLAGDAVAIERVAKAARGIAENVQITVGEAQGQRVKFKAPQLEISTGRVVNTPGQPSRVTLTGIATTDTPEAEFEILYD